MGVKRGFRESLVELRGDSGSPWGVRGDSLGTPQGVDEYNQGRSRKPPLESPENYKFLKFGDSPGSFRGFLKYATPQGVPGDFVFFRGLPRDFVGESRLGSTDPVFDGDEEFVDERT